MYKSIFFALSFLLLLTTSCDKDDNEKQLFKSFDIALSASNSIPMVVGRNETGDISMKLYDDNSLEFTITVDNLLSTDDLGTAHVHTGDVVSTGGVEITLVDGTDIAFSGNTVTGTINLTDAQIITLQGSDVYVNVHSTQSASGLVRGQIDQKIDNAYNVALSPANQVPTIMGKSETGSAYFRLVGTTMYYKVIANDLEVDDAITAGHIHEGTSTENGGVLVNLEMSQSVLDITQSVALSSDEITKINNDALYVNIHSTAYPAGLLRGQIR